MAFHRASQAIAVVRVASRSKAKPWSSDAGWGQLEPVAEHPLYGGQLPAINRTASVRVSMLHSDDGSVSAGKAPANGACLHFTDQLAGLTPVAEDDVQLVSRMHSMYHRITGNPPG